MHYENEALKALGESKGKPDGSAFPFGHGSTMHVFVPFGKSLWPELLEGPSIGYVRGRSVSNLTYGRGGGCCLFFDSVIDIIILFHFMRSTARIVALGFPHHMTQRGNR
jgi:hypothetical protein